MTVKIRVVGALNLPLAVFEEGWSYPYLVVYFDLIALKWLASYKTLLFGNCPDLYLRRQKGGGGLSKAHRLAEEKEAQRK